MIIQWVDVVVVLLSARMLTHKLLVSTKIYKHVSINIRPISAKNRANGEHAKSEQHFEHLYVTFTFSCDPGAALRNV